MTDVIHEHDSTGYGGWIVGVVVAILLLFIVWWLFWSGASPLTQDNDTLIIEPPAQTQPQTQPQDNTDVDVVVPPPAEETTP